MTRLRAALVAFTICAFGCGAPPDVQSDAHATSPLQQAAVAFEGGHSEHAIQAKLDEAFALYGLPKTAENYSRAGSVLVTMRKEHGVPEMRILDHMIRSNVPGANIAFPQAAAISGVALAAGDR